MKGSLPVPPLAHAAHAHPQPVQTPRLYRTGMSMLWGDLDHVMQADPGSQVAILPGKGGSPE